MTISVRITEYDPNRRLSFEHTSGPMKGSIMTESLENIDGKTRFTFSHDLKLSARALQKERRENPPKQAHGQQAHLILSHGHAREE